ncbi:MAG: hypothetical protein U0900_19695 [Myxococcota bacterium]
MSDRPTPERIDAGPTALATVGARVAVCAVAIARALVSLHAFVALCALVAGAGLFGAGLAFAADPIAAAPALAVALPAEAAAPAASALPAWAEAAFESLRGIPPLLFFGGFVLATFVPFPVGLFYMAAGVAYGVGPALAWIAASLAASNLILHTAARRFLRPWVEPIVVRRGYRIPRFDSGLDEIFFITLIRLTPGIPYFLQNWILAVAQLDLVRFLVLSVAIQMIYVTGFVVLGRSALDGELGWALGGLAVLVAVSALARHLARRRKPGEPPI